MDQRLSLVIFCFLFLQGSVYAETTSILVNKPQSEHDKRYDYPHALLEKALDITSKNYSPARIKHTSFEMNRTRMLRELIKGDHLHVVAEAPKPDWVKNLLVIRIPIRKGIQGIRLFLIDQNKQSAITAIDSYDQFKTLPTGTGALWSTTRVLKTAGFNTVEGTTYEGLFSMLQKGRFMTFGRGLNEIDAEYETNKEHFPDLVIEQKFALNIPLPTYFFVTPSQPELAKRIEEGLELMITDGSFDELFYQFHGELLNKHNLGDRTIFTVPNPNLTPEDPIHIKKYWHQISKN